MELDNRDSQSLTRAVYYNVSQRNTSLASRRYQPMIHYDFPHEIS